MLEKNKNNPSFILHSGPPYANSKIHLGHVLNFLIKDIIIRFQAGQGKYTPFLLGWDTHGLPIEHKMIQAYQGQKINLRQVCHDFALEQVKVQKEQLKKLGLLLSLIFCLKANKGYKFIRLYLLLNEILAYLV